MSRLLLGYPDLFARRACPLDFPQLCDRPLVVHKMLNFPQRSWGLGQLGFGPEAAIQLVLEKVGNFMNYASRSASVLLLLIMTACSQPLSFKGGLPASQSNLSNPTCTPGETTKAVPTKFLFIVDQSGSNVDGPFEHPGIATDPVKAFRYGVISDFVGKQSGKANLSWGFLSFAGTQVAALINSGDTSHPIFSDATAIKSALQTFLVSADSGDTPYRLALSTAHDLIQADIAKSTVAYQYRIAFLTDGYPTDYCPTAGATSCPGQILEGQIDSDIASVINLAPQAIQMSTVYYGLPDATASGRLQRMARDGNGQFVDTNVSKIITLDDVIKVPTNCP